MLDLWRSKLRVVIVVAVLIGVAALVLMAQTTRSQQGAGADHADASGDPKTGAALYQGYCASCHGDKLQGQPDWRSQGADGVLPAPPHDKAGHTWHHGDGLLFTYTKLGGQEVMSRQGVEFNSGMPGFGDQLSDQQILDVLAYIKSTWPDRERQVQAGRSQAEQSEQSGD